MREALERSFFHPKQRTPTDIDPTGLCALADGHLPADEMRRFIDELKRRALLEESRPSNHHSLT